MSENRFVDEAIGTASGPEPESGPSDRSILNFALNLEYLEAEFYLRDATGEGLPERALSGRHSSTTGSWMTVFEVIKKVSAVRNAVSGPADDDQDLGPRTTPTSSHRRIRAPIRPERPIHPQHRLPRRRRTVIRRLLPHGLGGDIVQGAAVSEGNAR